MPNDWKNQFVEANALLRTCLSVTRRNGKTTNWDALRKKIEAALDDQHELVTKIRADDGS